MKSPPRPINVFAETLERVRACGARSGFRRAPMCRAFKSSRRARPVTAISRPMPPWCWPRVSARIRSSSPTPSATKLRRRTTWSPTSMSRSPASSISRLKPGAWTQELRRAVAAGQDYGRSDIGAGVPVNVEYVSANPTGPMHVGHCRGAVFGDALASLLAFTGFKVTREYYINDAGTQVDVLARSAFLRYREALGENIGAIPEGLYPGDYLKPVGAALAAEYGDKLKAQPEAQWLPVVRAKSIAMMMAAIRADLAALNVKFDVFFSERSLIAGAADRVAETIEWLRERGYVYEGRLPPPKGAAGGLGGSRTDTVPFDRFRRRRRSRVEEVGRLVHLFRLRHCLSPLQDRTRLPHPDRRLGRRSRRLHQAHAGGRRGAERPQGRARRQGRAACEAVARRRAGQNVEAGRGVRHVT